MLALSPGNRPLLPGVERYKNHCGTRLKTDRSRRLDKGNVEQLSDRVGVGARHLSRLFKQHIGASPTQAAKTFRLQRAKRMLNDTDLSITEIAYRAGFGSLRRFNAAFSELYDRPPSKIRKAPKEDTQNEQS